MGKRTWIDSDIWSDTDDLSAEDRVLYLCLLTNSQRNIAGYYRLSLEHFALDMRMSVAEVKKRLKAKNKYWVYDEQTGQVLIPKYTKYNVVRSPQQFRKLNAELCGLRPCKLHKTFVEAFVECNGTGAETLLDVKFLERAKPYK